VEPNVVPRPRVRWIGRAAVHPPVNGDGHVAGVTADQGRQYVGLRTYRRSKRCPPVLREDLELRAATGHACDVTGAPRTGYCCRWMHVLPPPGRRRGRARRVGRQAGREPEARARGWVRGPLPADADEDAAPWLVVEREDRARQTDDVARWVLPSGAKPIGALPVHFLPPRHLTCAKNVICAPCSFPLRIIIRVASTWLQRHPGRGHARSGED
jgi:hypothetical protein